MLYLIKEIDMTPEEQIAALRDALEKNVQHCGADECGAIATWNIRDYDLSEYACDEHLESERARWHVFSWKSYELPQARLAIAVLAATA
jgi:hypothetical protein